MFGSQVRPGMRGPLGLGLFGSQTRPGMRGSSLGSLAGCPFAESSLARPSLAGSCFAGDSLGATEYRLMPTSGDDGELPDASAAQDKLNAYGAKVATTLIAHAKQLPAADRAAMMRAAMNAIDPTLYDRARRNADAIQQTGVSAATALEIGIARAVADGFVAQLAELGAQQATHGALAGPIVWNPTAATSGYKPGTVIVPGTGGSSIVKSLITTIKNLPSTFLGIGGAVGTQAVKAADTVKDLTCTLLQSGGAQAAVSVAAAKPTGTSLAVGAGAVVASQMCGGQAAAPAVPTYAATNSNLPLYAAAGGAALLLILALRKKRHHR